MSRYKKNNSCVSSFWSMFIWSFLNTEYWVLDVCLLQEPPVQLGESKAELLWHGETVLSICGGLSQGFFRKWGQATLAQGLDANQVCVCVRPCAQLLMQQWYMYMIHVLNFQHPFYKFHLQLSQFIMSQWLVYFFLFKSRVFSEYFQIIKSK